MAMLLACMMQAHPANAAASPSLSASADAAGVSEGGYVNVSVNLSGNPSISTIGMALAYDSSVLRYESASWNSGFSGSDMKMASDTGSEVNLSAVCDSSYSADGTVVTVRFQAVSDSSSVPVTLSLRWSSFFVTLTRKSFIRNYICVLFSNGVIYPFEECGRI